MEFEFHFYQETYPWHTKAPTIIIKLPIIMKPQPNITAKPPLTMKPATTRALLTTLTLPTATRCTRRITAKRPPSTTPTSTGCPHRKPPLHKKAPARRARQRALLFSDP